MKEPDFIEVYENSIDPELCTELVEWFEDASSQGFTINNMRFDEGNSSRGVTRADESFVYPCHCTGDGSFGERPPDDSRPRPVGNISLANEVCEAYWNSLTPLYTQYMNKYSIGGFNLSCLTFKIHKVIEGQGYHVWHHETKPRSQLQGDRVLTWMSYLQAPEEGGETEFLHQAKRIKPEVGTTLIWPAYFTHLHRGGMVLKGEKIYITGWFELA